MPPTAEIDAFLGSAGLRDLAEAELLRGGANNRVYRVPSAESARWGGGGGVLKVYFRRAGDAWDRFAAESAFYRYAGPRAGEFLCSPRAWSSDLRAGCFEWVDGESFTGCEIGEAEVAKAAEFVRQLQTGREASSLEAGAEAVFSGPEHASLISGRLRRLKDGAITDDLSAEAREFVMRELEPRWRGIEEKVRSLPPLASHDRCVSPSDFGFHNALRRDGRVWFIDFEYAGMDDPAKLVCDFFWQPAVPVPWDLRELFLTSLEGCLGDDRAVVKRTEALFPAFGLKWCCIVLNDFVRADRARREFALGDPGEVDRRREQQLAKARAMAERI